MHNEEQLQKYRQGPKDYIKELDDSVEAVNILIDLLCLTNHEPMLQQLITSITCIDIKYITASTYPLKDRLNLLSLVYLAGPHGTPNITDYYWRDYNQSQITNNFDLNAHGKLIALLITKLNILLETKTTNIQIDTILHLANVISDLDKNKNTLDKTILAAIMPIYFILDKNKSILSLGSTQAQDQTAQLITSIDEIAKHLYGMHKNNVLNIARTFNLMHKQDYWLGCLTSEHTSCMTEDLLPNF